MRRRFSWLLVKCQCVNVQWLWLTDVAYWYCAQFSFCMFVFVFVQTDTLELDNILTLILVSSDLSASESSFLCTLPQSSSSAINQFIIFKNSKKQWVMQLVFHISDAENMARNIYKSLGNKCHRKFILHLLNGKRPKPVKRRQMTPVLKDQMRIYEANPIHAQCVTVVWNIIRQDPNSFADITPEGSLLGGGYTSLLIK